MAYLELERAVLFRAFEAVQCAEEMETETGLTRTATGRRVGAPRQRLPPPTHPPSLSLSLSLPLSPHLGTFLACTMSSLTIHRPELRVLLVHWRLQAGAPDADPDPAPTVWYNPGAAAPLPPEVVFIALMVAVAHDDTSIADWISAVLSQEQRWFEVRRAAFR